MKQTFESLFIDNLLNMLSYRYYNDFLKIFCFFCTFLNLETVIYMIGFGTIISKRL